MHRKIILHTCFAALTSSNSPTKHAHFAVCLTIETFPHCIHAQPVPQLLPLTAEHYSTGWYTSDHATCWLLARGRTGESVGQEALRTHRHAFTVCFEYIRSDCCSECTPSRVNVFWKICNAAWPFRSEPSSDHAVPTAAMYSVRGLR
jgi:hypothetical protein